MPCYRTSSLVPRPFIWSLGMRLVDFKLADMNYDLKQHINQSVYNTSSTSPGRWCIPQMACGPGSISRTWECHSSTRHWQRSTSWNWEPMLTQGQRETDVNDLWPLCGLTWQTALHCDPQVAYTNNLLLTLIPSVLKIENNVMCCLAVLVQARLVHL